MYIFIVKVSLKNWNKSESKNTILFYFLLAKLDPDFTPSTTDFSRIKKAGKTLSKSGPGFANSDPDFGSSRNQF